jgi:hypothetical protein
MEFPLLYAGLTAHRPWSAWPVLVLAARNVVLVGLFVGALRAAWAVAGEGESARHAAGAPPARA